MRHDGMNTSSAFKLGIFCLNVGGGLTMTEAHSTELSWDENLRVAREADAHGWDFLLPLGRWKGIGGKTNPYGEQYENFTWAAAIAAATERIHVFSTTHVSLYHPVLASKMTATIDHVSNSRFGLNLVAGWNQAEFGMFGMQQPPHDERYAVAHEWLDIVEQLWEADQPINVNGTYYRIEAGEVKPGLRSANRVPIIAAGSSGVGLDFALRRADYSFVNSTSIDGIGELASRILERGARMGSTTKIMTFGPVVVRDTMAEAQEYFRWYVDELGDQEAAINLVRQLVLGESSSTARQAAGLPDDKIAAMARHFVAGWGGLPLVGTPESITDDLLRLRAAGVSGMAFGWVDYLAGVQEFNEKVMPLLEEAGLR